MKHYYIHNDRLILSKLTVMSITDTKHIPLYDTFVIRDMRKWILVVHFRYLRYGNCYFRLLKNKSLLLLLFLHAS